jgi:CubicO group peptidase (beta-lactamase class C family)
LKPFSERVAHCDKNGVWVCAQRLPGRAGTASAATDEADAKRAAILSGEQFAGAAKAPPMTADALRNSRREVGLSEVVIIVNECCPSLTQLDQGRQEGKRLGSQACILGVIPRNPKRMTLNRRTFLRQLSLGTAGLGLVTFLPGCQTIRPAFAGRKLPRSTPEAEGVSSSGILAFLDAVAHSKHELHSFMIARHGHVVAEGWWTPYGPQFNHTLYSLSKSFTSTGVGFAVSEGRLTVNDKVISFFPNDLPAKVSDNLAALRVQDLLSMSVGDEKEPTRSMVLEENWVKAFLAAPITHPPGSTFMYNSGATYMCSAIVQQVTGQKVVDYLRPRLFEPLGIEGMTWETCPRGINTGGWGLSVQTESLAKFGQFYLQKGMWNGRQLLPAEWVEEATTFKIQQPVPANARRPKERNDWTQGYCYQFWRCTHNAFRGDGAFGQFCVVMPAQEAVVVITGQSNDLQGELDLVWEHLLPAMKSQAPPADGSVESRLKRTLGALALAMPKGQLSSSTAALVSGKNFKLEANDLGLQSVSLAYQKEGCVLTFRDTQTVHAIACGIGKWQRGETSLPGTPPRLISGGAPRTGTKSRIATSGAWKDQNTFELMLRYYETPHHDTLTCRFDSDHVTMSFLSSIAAMNPAASDKRPVLQGKWI